MSEYVRQDFYAREIVGIDERHYDLLLRHFDGEEPWDEGEPPNFDVEEGVVTPYLCSSSGKWFFLLPETDCCCEWELPEDCGYTDSSMLSSAGRKIAKAAKGFLDDSFQQIRLGPVFFRSQSWYNGADRPAILPESEE